VATRNDAPIDHKGRSRPLYERRGGSAQPVRTARWTRLVQGFFPGLRIIAQEDVTQGIPFTILGVVVAGVGVVLWAEWSATAAQLERLHAHPSLMLAHAGLLWLLLWAFEALRLGSAFTDRSRGPRTPRFISTLLFPSLAVVLATPVLAPLAPRPMEALVVAAAVTALGAVPATLASVLQTLMPPSGARTRMMRVAGAAYAALLLSGLGLAVAVAHPESASRVESWGLVVVGRVLR
jgi:hypothetical protein